MAEERSKDIFEQLPAYPKPPLVPLPEFGDIQSMERMGIRINRTSSAILNTFFTLSGFRAYWRRFPQLEEEALRNGTLRLPGLFLPLISATAGFADDPRRLGMVDRACTLLFAVHSLFTDVFSGSFPPDELKGQALEMGQYPNLFSTSLVIEGKQVRMFKSTQTAQVTVIAGGRIYLLQTGAPGSGATVGGATVGGVEFSQVRGALEAILQDAQAHPLPAGQPRPGWLTCGSDATQLRIFNNLVKLDPENARSLQALRHSLFTLCLDLDSNPETDEDAAYQIHVGNLDNRWFHSSLQLVATANGKAGAVINFTTNLDGNVMSRAAAEIQRRAAQLPIPPPGADAPTAAPLPWRELKFTILPRMEAAARADIEPLLEPQPVTFTLPNFSRQVCREQGIDPVSTFICALQMAADRLVDEPARITQFLTMSRYRCMDLITAMVSTPEVQGFSKMMTGPNAPSAGIREQLQAAAAAQEAATRKARRILHLPMILSLYGSSRRGLMARYVDILFTLTLTALKLCKVIKLEKREIIVSHPAIYPEIPVIGRPGIRMLFMRYFGLHYQIWEDRTVLTFMPGQNWKIPSRQLAQGIETSLEEILSRLDQRDV